MSQLGYSVAWRWGFDRMIGTAYAVDSPNNGDTVIGTSQRMVYSGHAMSNIAAPNGAGGNAVITANPGDYLQCGDVTVGDVGTSSFTLAFWIKPVWTGVPVNNDRIIGKTSTNISDGPGYFVGIDTTWLYLYAYDANGGLNNQIRHYQTENVWVHVAISNTNTATGGLGYGTLTSYFYINGALAGTDYTYAPIQRWNFTSSLTTAKFFKALSNYGRHSLDDAWIIKQACTASEVNELYNVMK